MADLARLLGFDESAQGLLERHRRVGAVELIEVDVVHTQPPQAPLQGGADVLGASVGAPHTRAAAREPGLGRHHDTVVGGQRLRDQLLTYVGTVGVGGVDEVHAELHHAPQQRNRATRAVRWRGRRTQTPGPGSCIAPKPRRSTRRSPSLIVPALLIGAALLRGRGAIAAWMGVSRRS